MIIEMIELFIDQLDLMLKIKNHKINVIYIIMIVMLVMLKYLK